MIRLLTARPTSLNLPQLKREASTAVGSVDVGTVGDQVAGYWPDGTSPDQAAFDAVVSAHVPLPPDPTPEDRIAELEAIIAALLEEPTP